MGAYPRLHSLVAYVNASYNEGSDGLGQLLLNHTPSKELRLLRFVIFPRDYLVDYPPLSQVLGKLDEALVTAAANSWRNVHFSFAVCARLYKEEDVMRRFREEGFPLLNATSPLDIVVVHGARPRHGVWL